MHLALCGSVTYSGCNIGTLGLRYIHHCTYIFVDMLGLILVHMYLSLAFYIFKILMSLQAFTLHKGADSTAVHVT